jgi:hypothetical protein
MRIHKAQMCERPWPQTVNLPATSHTLQGLFSGRVAGLCIPDFLTKAECEELIKRIGEWEFSQYRNVSPPINRLGITVFEYDGLGKAEYFKAVEEANRNTARITEGIDSPVQRVMDWLSSLVPNTPISRAVEVGYGQYFAGLLRRIEEGTLIHVDFAPAEHPTWGVGQVINQMAWNIYLKVPAADPGFVYVWKKQWRQEDDVYKIPGSYGYIPEVVEGVPFAKITPKQGMLMMINTRNFHQVLPSAGIRLAMSAAAGCTADKRIVFWS